MHNQKWQLHRILQLKTLKSFTSGITSKNKSSEVNESQEIEVLEAEDLSSFMVEANALEDHQADPPAVLVMRRKQIRQFSNNQRVALYYVDKINKYVTVPYTAMQWSAGNMPESVEHDINVHQDVMSQLKSIVENKSTQNITFKDGKSMRVNESTAKAVLNTYNELNHENKKNVSAMVNESKEKFSKVVDFAWKHSK